MGYMTNGLTFNALRGANIARLPQFKNKHGGLAHSKPDGSDWSPAQWFGALLGEIGEMARVRLDYDRGNTDHKTFEKEMANELADVQCYLDIFARRCLDEVNSSSDVPNRLMALIALLGEFANEKKKYDRGDIKNYELEMKQEEFLEPAAVLLSRLAYAPLELGYNESTVTQVHPTDGVDLGRATMDKFNKVSERVGSTVRLDADDWHYTETP